MNSCVCIPVLSQGREEAGVAVAGGSGEAETVDPMSHAELYPVLLFTPLHKPRDQLLGQNMVQCDLAVT